MGPRKKGTRKKGRGKINRPRKQGQVRIIAGHWRGRKISFPDAEGLRPSPDRVRETLFNWLQPVISGARCLDLFAGSGVLGFEALSRGAASLTMVENNPVVFDSLAQQASSLGAEGCEIIQDDAMKFLSRPSSKYHIVFADPPFARNMLSQVCEALHDGGHLLERALVYVESDCNIPDLDNFEIFKQGSAGAIYFKLLRLCPGRTIK